MPPKEWGGVAMLPKSGERKPWPPRIGSSSHALQEWRLGTILPESGGGKIHVFQEWGSAAMLPKSGEQRSCSTKCEDQNSSTPRVGDSKISHRP